jgi:putative Holliday junction resolvase
MPICEGQDLVKKLERGRRLMGVDLGEKNIGIALSDTTRCIASPYGTIPYQGKDRSVCCILDIATQHQVAGIIMGLPTNMNGTDGSQANKMREFSHALSGQSSLPIVLWDERLSTMAVNRTLINADRSRKRRSKVVDKLAATYILQGALDYLQKRELIQV